MQENALLVHNELSSALLGSIREKNPKNIALVLRLFLSASNLSCICKAQAIDCLVLVPSSRSPWKNESSGLELLAFFLAKELRISFMPRILEKTRAQSQHSMPGRSRLDTSIFIRVRPEKEMSCVEKRVLLLDDVLTTGTSMLQAEIALRKAGVAEIQSFTILKRKLMVVMPNVEGKEQ